jgi:hypothetical protein
MPRDYQGALKAWKEFLESTPAYVDSRIENLLLEAPGAATRSLYIASPRIQLYCEVDDGVRWFDCTTEKVWCRKMKAEFIHYVCRDCGNWQKTYAVVIVQDANDDKSVTATKLGELPPFGSHLARRLQEMLSKDDLELYRKGLRSERAGHGVGAAAYFRRVVENQWRVLVKRLRDAAEKLGTPASQLGVFDDALKQTQFSAAVEMLKHAIPPKLLILDGQNPLTLLYNPLSIQIHELSDEQCLQQAADIRTVLNELFDNITDALKDDEHLKDAVSRLQRKS